jgi:hypothetical protein
MPPAAERSGGGKTLPVVFNRLHDRSFVPHDSLHGDNGEIGGECTIQGSIRYASCQTFFSVKQLFIALPRRQETPNRGGWRGKRPNDELQMPRQRQIPRPPKRIFASHFPEQGCFPGNFMRGPWEISSAPSRFFLTKPGQPLSWLKFRRTDAVHTGGFLKGCWNEIRE